MNCHLSLCDFSTGVGHLATTIGWGRLWQVVTESIKNEASQLSGGDFSLNKFAIFMDRIKR